MSAGEQPVFEVKLRSKRVQRELDNLQKVDYERVVVKLRALATNPRPQGCEKIYDAIYRVRVGDFRISYLIDEQNKWIEVGAIRRRTERTCKSIEELFH
jgi:mRNA interferase RelE/StbE